MGVLVYFPGGSTPIVSILTEKSSKFVIKFFLFDIKVFCTYNLGIKTSLEQQQPLLSRALAQLFRLLTHKTKDFIVFEAVVLVCYLGLASDCRELHDSRGPYKTEILCKQRVVEISTELPTWLPNYMMMGYRCNEFTPEKDFPA